METTSAKKFRLADYVKAADLAAALRNEMAELRGEQRTAAEEAIVEVASLGVTGDFDRLLDAYKQAIQRALHPERKLLKNPQIDRKIVRNPQLAAFLDRELTDVTSEELAATNAALKAVFDEARDLVIESGPNEVRYVTHKQSATCHAYGRHPTVPAEDKQPCGYFRPPEEWREVLRQVVRTTLKR